MARRRMIDPNIWSSEDMSKLTIRQRLLVIGLFSNADDYGKGKAKATYIRSIVFPYDDISVNEIIDDLEAIRAVITIQFYEVEGNSYYKFTNWEKWQTVQKPQPSIIPEPVENDSGMILDPVHPKRKEEKRKEEKVKEEEVSGGDPYIIVLNHFCSLHQKLDLHMRDTERQDIRELISMGIDADFITNTMEKIFKHRTEKGEKIKSFSYYTEAIKEAWKGGQAHDESGGQPKGIRSGSDQETSGSESITGGQTGWLNSKYNQGNIIRMPNVSG